MNASKLVTMDDPKLYFSGESKDWSRFKQDIQSRADRYDTTWLFEGGRQWALFLARQIKDKTGTAAAKKKALERELNPKDDSNYVPTSCDDYTDVALHKWFEERDFATNLMLSLNKNRLASLGSNFCDHTKLGFKDEAALKKAHKAVDIAYLRKVNRSACKLFAQCCFRSPVEGDDRPHEVAQHFENEQSR